MTNARAASLQQAMLTAQDDFTGWRDQARALLAADVAPEHVVWTVAGDASPDLFATDTVQFFRAGHHAVRISRDLLGLLHMALMHRDPSRFARAYRLLWRLQSDNGIAENPADPDMIALRELAKAVKRDIHKMHAFVRFRKVDEMGGREQFAAWFEPDHHIARATAGFFRDRFTGMDWLIVTPEASISWDGSTLREGPGGVRGDVPTDDAVEAEWRAYYASIFNPARLKVDAMKREMPVRYWRNLPEAQLISTLVQDASRRVGEMIEHKPKAARADESMQESAETRARFDSLEALYRTLRKDDMPPSPDFSDHIVLGEGPLNASIMFVGEQPGDQEDVLGRPFVGPAGQLLDRCLAAARIARDTCFLTNAVKRFKFQPRGKRRLHQTPSAGDVTHYRWWLAEEVRIVRPTIIVALGATALHALSGHKQALGPVRGSVMTFGESSFMPTVHPSFLLRLPDEQARDIERDKFVRDLRKATDLARAA